MHSPDVPVKHRSEVRRRADAGVSRASGELEAGGEEEGQGSSTAAAARPEVAGLAGGKVLAGDGKCNGCDEAGLREQAGWVLAFHLLDARTEEQLDVALLEYCDFLYLNSEDSSFGQSSRRL